MSRMSRVVVQFMDSPREYAMAPPGGATSFRQGLRDWVLDHLSGQLIKVVIIEADTNRVEAIDHAWSKTPYREIVVGHFTVANSSPKSLAYWIANNSHMHLRIATNDKLEVERYSPNAPLEEIALPTVTYSVLDPLIEGADDVTLSFHSDTTPVEVLRGPIERWRPGRVLIAQPTEEMTAQMRHLGYRFAGRPWGEAGASAAFVVDDRLTVNDHRNALVVRVGKAVERSRSRIPPDHVRNAYVRKLRHRVSRSSPRDVLDPTFGVPPAAPDHSDVNALLGLIRGPLDLTWNVDIDDAQKLRDRASRCFSEFGVWPISFSIPGSSIRAPLPSNHRTHLVSPIVPGYPYAFTNHDDYLSTYARSFLAVTHRKAGWDCFRHLEILASGSAPLMVDVDHIPEFSMIHYPKQALKKILENAQIGGVPSHQVYLELRRFVMQHLTTRTMAKYILDRAHLDDVGKVLFVDAQHPNSIDYLSTLTLIGLKELFGRECVPLFQPPWIYRDFQGDSSHLYGRGFGTTRALDPHLKSLEEIEAKSALESLEIFDTVIVGSISRNLSRAHALLQHFPPDRTIWIHGEDTPPLAEEMRTYRASGAHLFVRSIDSPGATT